MLGYEARPKTPDLAGENRALREKLAAMGALPAPTTVAEFEAFIRAEVAKWAPVVKSGVKMSD